MALTRGFAALPLIVACIAGASLPACSTSGCLDNQSAIPLAEFYSSATGQAISLNNITIRGVGAPADSAILVAPPAASQVYLPMRSTRNSTSWRISYQQPGIDDPAFDDVVTFTYDSEPYFASAECGAMYCYRIRKVECTTNLLDSVSILDSLITNVDRPSMRFYFRTAEEPGEEAETI